MTKNKIIIGSGVLLVLGVGAYFLLKKQSAGNNIPSGTAPKVYPPNTLVKVKDSDPVYVIGADGARHHIPTRAKFDAYGYTRDNIKQISKAEMQAIPEGAALAGLTYILNGII
jgi:hypothetical protein